MRRHDDITCIMCGALMDYQGNDYYECPNCGNTAVGDEDDIEYSHTPNDNDDPDICEFCPLYPDDYPDCMKGCEFMDD